MLSWLVFIIVRRSIPNASLRLVAYRTLGAHEVLVDKHRFVVSFSESSIGPQTLQLVNRIIKYQMELATSLPLTISSKRSVSSGLSRASYTVATSQQVVGDVGWLDVGFPSPPKISSISFPYPWFRPLQDRLISLLHAPRPHLAV